MYIPDLDLLDAGEERRLARRYRATRDPRIAERLVRGQLRMVMMIAKHYRFSGHDERDLFQAGAVGLLHALAKYDPDRGVRLSTYAVSWIHAKILAFLWENRRLVRAAWRRRSRAREEARDHEAAEALRRHLRTPERDLDLPLPAPDDQRPDRLVEDAELRARLRRSVDGFAATLSPRERVILAERWLSEDPPTLETLGARFGVTRERTRQLESALLGRLRNHVTAELGK
jgi:RNA polymerase sigma-32 factor